MNEIKKIAIVANKIENVSETFIARHIKELNNGNNVIIYREESVNNKYEHPSYHIKTSWWYNYPKIIRHVVQFIQLYLNGYHLVPDHFEKESIKRFLIKNQVNVILAEYGPLGCLILPVAKELNIPIFTYFRGKDASKSLEKWNIRYAYRKMVPEMDGIFAVSPHLLENLKSIGVEWKNASVIPSGVDTNKFVPRKKDENLILSVGRFVEKKSPLTTIKTFHTIVQKFPNKRLVMIGDGPLFNNASKLASDLEIDNKIKFLGSKSHDVVADYMSRASIFILHSIKSKSGDTEGFPSVIQEALSSGTAVLTTKHAGNSYFITNYENGVLVNENDLEAFKTELNKLLSNKNLLKRLQSNGRIFAELNFDQKILYSKLMKNIDEISQN